MYLVVCQIEFEIEIISKKHYKSYTSLILFVFCYIIFFLLLLLDNVIIRDYCTLLKKKLNECFRKLINTFHY